MTDRPIRWGILGPGGIARDFLAGAAGSELGVVEAVGARQPPRPDLAGHFPGVRIVPGYEALIADPAIDAIYVATPHPMHAPWAIAAAQAGKHVLCEKPMAMSTADVEAMFGAAARAGTFMGEAFMYRFHPLIARVVELLRGDAIGTVRMVKASFGFAMPQVDPAHRLFDPALGGGALLDLGGYVTSIAGLIAGLPSGEGMPEPVAVKAVGHIGATGVDKWTSAVLRYADGMVADLSCSITLRQDNVLHILGTTGRLEVDQFWFGTGKAGGRNTIRLIRPDGSVEPVTVTEPRNLYAFQFEAANRAIAQVESGFAWPGLTPQDSIANARLIDRWKEQIHG